MCTVSVIYALLKQQDVKIIVVDNMTTIEATINKSGILDEYPEIDLSINKVGIFNQVKKLTDIVKENDRIEIYRPLIADPKDVRRKRAEKQKIDGII